MAVVVSLLLFFIIIGGLGFSVSDAFWSFVNSSVGSLDAISESLVKASPLLIVGTSIAIAFQSNVINIGAEGQMIVGAIFATWFGINFEWPLIVSIPIIIGLSFAAGGVFGSVAGYIKAKWGVNEILTTIMMNYVAIYTLDYVVRGPLSTPDPWPRSPRFFGSAVFPRIIPGLRVHFGLIIGVVGCILAYIYLFKTPGGFGLRTAGASPEIATRSGINVERKMILAMFLSGGFAGLGGAGEVAGVHRYLSDGISAGYGFLAIPVALIARLRPQLVLFVGTLFGFLITGIHGAFRTVGLPVQGVDMYIGLVMIAVLFTGYMVRYRVRRV